MTCHDGLQALLRRADDLLRSHRIPEAIRAHEELLKACPDLADSWYNLAWLQRQDRRFEAALASYREALDWGVEAPEEVHLNRAVIFTDHLGREDLGEAELRAALGIDRCYLPALLNLGNLYEDRGDGVQAVAAYQQALAVEPHNATALSRLAGLSVVSGPDDPLIVRLRSAISTSSTSAADKALLGFELGHALDAVGSYDLAFAAFTAANQASRASASPPGACYDAPAQEDLIDRLIRAFARPADGACLGEAEPPIFICGMFRSGSTLAEQILASHPRVTAGGELDLLPTLVRSRLSPYPERSDELGPEMLRCLREEYMDGLRKIHPDADLVTDKRPDNFLHIGLIKSLFPRAKIVHTRRDALDNCMSIYFLHLSHDMSYALDLADTAHWYRQYLRLMAHWKALYPEDIYDLDYDRLVADPARQIKGLLDFCSLAWADQCLSFHTAPTLVRTASAWQVRKPLYRRSSGRWRNYERHLEPLRVGLGGLSGEA